MSAGISLIITVAVAVCYYIYNFYMLEFFDKVSGRRTGKRCRLFMALLNYAVFILISSWQFYLIVNWSIISIVFTVEIYLLYRVSMERAVCLGLQGALLGLAVNSITRTLMALLIHQPLAAFDARVANYATNFKLYPIGLGFLLTGLLFAYCCDQLKDGTVLQRINTVENTRMFMAMSASFFVVLDLNLLIYLVDGSETIIKLWVMKSAICVLIGDIIYMRHILTMAKYLDYEWKGRHMREELEAGQVRNKEMESAAYYDILTNCQSRTAAEKRLEQLHEAGEKFWLCYLDLDRLKVVNDELGHEAGDLYLSTVGQVLRETLREDVELYRYGGDEFLAIALSGTQEELEQDLTEVLQVLQEHSNSPEYPFLLSLSYGAASSSECADLQELLYLADSRMYEKKHKNGNGRLR